MVYQFNMESKDTSPLADIPATGALPVYLRIAELVSRQIDAGILADGHRLPPEREMADAHGVSVGTLRKALARLTEMGCLERRQGSGNYIRQTDRSAAIYTMFRLERPDGGGLPTARLLSVRTLKPAADIRPFAPDGQAHRFRREFPLPSGTPAGYVERNGWSQDGAWAEYSRTWYGPAAARFVARQR